MATRTLTALDARSIQLADDPRTWSPIGAGSLASALEPAADDRHARARIEDHNIVPDTRADRLEVGFGPPRVPAGSALTSITLRLWARKSGADGALIGGAGGQQIRVWDESQSHSFATPGVPANSDSTVLGTDFSELTRDSWSNSSYFDDASLGDGADIWVGIPARWLPDQAFGVDIDAADVELEVQTVPAAPGAPTLIAPGDGAAGQSRTPTFRWASGGGVRAPENGSFLVEVSYSASMDGPFISQTIQPRADDDDPDGEYEWTPTTPLAYYRRVYWRVMASNQTGQTYSAVRSFRPIARGNVVFGFDGATAKDPMLWLDFNETSGDFFDGVRGERFTVIGTRLPITTADRAGNSGTALDLVGDGNRRLISGDLADVTPGSAEFTVAGWLRPDNVASGSTKHVWCKNEDTGAGTADPTTAWRIRWTNVFIFARVNNAQNGLITLTNSGVTLTTEKRYLFAARLDEHNVLGAGADRMHLAVRAHDAGSLSNVNGAGHGVPTSDATPIAVGVVMSNSAPFQPGDGRVDSLCVFDACLTDAQVNALWAGGVGLTYEEFIGPPRAFALLTPANGAKSANRRPSFTWQPSQEAASYTIEAARDAGFADVVLSQSGVTVESFTPADALPAATLHWRVTAVNNVGSTACASAFSLHIQAATALRRFRVRAR